MRACVCTCAWMHTHVCTLPGSRERVGTTHMAHGETPGSRSHAVDIAPRGSFSPFPASHWHLPLGLYLCCSSAAGGGHGGPQSVSSRVQALQGKGTTVMGRGAVGGAGGAGRTVTQMGRGAHRCWGGGTRVYGELAVRSRITRKLEWGACGRAGVPSLAGHSDKTGMIYLRGR